MYLDIEGINNTSPASSMTLLTPEANRPQLKDKPHSYGWCGMTKVDIEISKETQSQLQFLRRGTSPVPMYLIRLGIKIFHWGMGQRVSSHSFYFYLDMRDLTCSCVSCKTLLTLENTSAYIMLYDCEESAKNMMEM